MPIQVKCECGRELWLGNDAAGKRFACPVCRSEFDVPAAAPGPNTPETTRDTQGPEPADLDAPVEGEPGPPAPPARRATATRVASIAVVVLLLVVGLVAWYRPRTPGPAPAPRPRAWPESVPTQVAEPPEPAAPSKAAAPAEVAVVPEGAIPPEGAAPPEPAPAAARVAWPVTEPQLEALLAAREPAWILASLDQGGVADPDERLLGRMRAQLAAIGAAYGEADEASVARTTVRDLNELREHGKIEMTCDEYLTAMLSIAGEWAGKPGPKPPYAMMSQQYKSLRSGYGLSNGDVVRILGLTARAMYASDEERPLAEAQAAEARDAILRRASEARPRARDEPPKAEAPPERGPAPVGRIYYGVYLRDIHHKVPVGRAPRLGERPEGVFIRKGTRVSLQQLLSQDDDQEWRVETRDGKVAIVGKAFIDKNVRVGR